MTKISDYKAQLLRQVREASDQFDSGAQRLLDLAGNDEKIAAVIERLNNPETPVADKLSAIKDLHVVGNFSKVLPTRSADLTNALRGLIKAPDPEVRRQALSYLSLIGDEIAQQHLRAELEADSPEAEKSVPTYQAIAMLSAHDKGIDKGLLLAIVQNPPDDESLVQAVRHLPADADTVAVLTGMLQDESKPIAARALVPEIVSQVDPDAFASVAKRMLEEQGTESEITPFLAQGIANIQTGSNSADFQEALAEIRALLMKGNARFNQTVDPGTPPDEAASDN